jgi:hypothetical protein
MADTSRLERALAKAHDAGDIQAARQLASEIKLQRSVVSPESSTAAAQGMGPLDTLAVGAGRGFDKLAMGLKQAVMGGVEKFAPAAFSRAASETMGQQAQEEAVKDSAYSGLAQARPITSGMGEAIPAIVATGGAGLVPGAVGVGVMEALKYGTPEERMQRGLVNGGGALIGGMIGNKLGNMIAPVAKNTLTSTKSAALKAAESMGYKPRLSEVTGSPFLSRVEDVAARTAGGAGVMQDFAQANQQAINRRAAQGIGEVADELTPKVFSDASTRLGKVFEDIKALPGKQINISQNVGNVADEVIAIQRKMIPSQRDAALEKLAQQAKILASNKGAIDGEAYQLARSGLSEASFDASGTTKALYGKLLSALDDSAEKSLKSSGNKALADALKTARPQYGNLKTLEKGLVSEGGQVSPARLAQALRSKSPAAFREGKLEGNPLYDIAKIGESLKPLTAGSPTYEREATSDILSLLLKAGPAYAAAKATTSPMMTAYPRLIATNPAAARIAGGASQLANPATKALAAALLQRTIGGGAAVPVMAEN